METARAHLSHQRAPGPSCAIHSQPPGPPGSDFHPQEHDCPMQALAPSAIVWFCGRLRSRAVTGQRPGWAGAACPSFSCQEPLEGGALRSYFYKSGAGQGWDRRPPGQGPLAAFASPKSLQAQVQEHAGASPPHVYTSAEGPAWPGVWMALGHRPTRNGILRSPQLRHLDRSPLKTLSRGCSRVVPRCTTSLQ